MTDTYIKKDIVGKADSAAVIDIGSNSIRYAAGRNGKKLVITTRLGSGLAQTGRLDEERMEKSISVISALASNARHSGYIPFAYATSAVRDASNKAEFVNRLKQKCGITVDVLSGEREAQYAFEAACNSSDGCSALIDIGGASMQIAEAKSKVSYPIGCVRGKDIALQNSGKTDCDDDFETQRTAINQYMDEIIGTSNRRLGKCAGIGGTITTLAALSLGMREYDRDEIGKAVLNKSEVERLIVALSTMGKERKLNPLLKERHDIIMYGAAVLAHAMELFGIEEVHARDREDAEPGRVHDEHERVEHALAAADEAAHKREKQHDRHAERDEQIDRVLKRARRRQPHDEIAQDAASDGRRDAQQPHAEDIHVLFDAEHRAADGERDRPGQFKQKEKGFHRHDLRKKSTPLPWCRCVLCPFT